WSPLKSAPRRARPGLRRRREETEMLWLVAAKLHPKFSGIDPQYHWKAEARRLPSGLRLRKKFVFVYDRGNGQLARAVVTIVYTNHLAFTAHPDRLRECDLGREGQGELNGRSGRNIRIDVKAYAPRTYVPGLGGFFLHTIFRIGNRNGKTQRKTASCPLFRVGFGHRASVSSCKDAWLRSQCQVCNYSALTEMADLGTA